MLVVYVLIVALSVSAFTASTVEGKQQDLSVVGLYSLINSYREENGLKTLNISDNLMNSAKYKSADIIDKDYWSHTSPSGQTFRHLMNRFGYSYTLAGENLAFGYESSNQVFTSWKDSPTHNSVLLHPEFEHFGIGISNGNFKGVEDITIVSFHTAAKAPVIETPDATTTAFISLYLRSPYCGFELASHGFDAVVNFLGSQCPVLVPDIQGEGYATPFFTTKYIASA